MACEHGTAAGVSSTVPAKSAPRRAVLLNDTMHDRHHGCTLVGRTIDNLATANGIELIARSPVHHDWRLDHKLLSEMQSAELIVVNGEGTIHHDRPAGLALLEAGAWGKKRGIPTALINMTWAANSRAAAQHLKQFSFVAVRESASKALLADLGVASYEAPDLALYSADPVPGPRLEVAVTDSVVPHVAAALEQVRRRNSGRYVNILYGKSGPREWVRSCRKFGAVAGASPRQIVHAIGAGVREHFHQNASADHFVSDISRSRLLITGRFHAVIVALATRTPVLAVASNTHKIESTLRDAGLQSFRVTTPEKIDSALIERASHWQPGELQALDDFVRRGRKEIEAMFTHVAGI